MYCNYNFFLICDFNFEFDKKHNNYSFNFKQFGKRAVDTYFSVLRTSNCYNVIEFY